MALESVGLRSYDAVMAGFDEIQVRLPDDYRAYARYWPVGEPRGAVLYQHGIQSHCGWYEGSATRLAAAGFAVLQIDRRGCGRNEKDRGHAESADQLIGDALAARDELRRRSGLGEIHEVGVSWGGKLVVAAYVTNPEGVKSLSLVMPGLFPNVGVSKEKATEIGFAMIYEPHKLYDIPLNDADRFTHDPARQAFFNTDPLTMRQCSAGFYLASRRMDKLIAKLPASPPVPIHLFVAGDERIIDNDKTVSFVRGLGFGGTRITEFPESRHCVEFEKDAASYFEQLTAFIAEAS